MSETVSLEFVTRRLDAVQNDQADLRRRMIALAERFGVVEARIGAIEGRMSGIENRMTAFEERMDLLIERMGRQESNISRALLLLERLVPAWRPRAGLRGMAGTVGVVNRYQPDRREPHWPPPLFQRLRRAEGLSCDAVGIWRCTPRMRMVPPKGCGGHQMRPRRRGGLWLRLRAAWRGRVACRRPTMKNSTCDGRARNARFGCRGGQRTLHHASGPNLRFCKRSHRISEGREKCHRHTPSA